MQALTLPAQRGWRWIAEGYRIYSKNRLMLSLIVFGYWMLMMVVNSVPVLGQIVATVCLPAMSVGLMNACRHIEQGTPLTPQVLFSGFTENLRTLLILGAIYMLAALFIFGMTALFDGGTLFHLFVIGGQTDESASADSIMLAAQVAMVFFLPLVMAYWYAPVLAAWHGYSPVKSLFFSLVACVRNWRTFLVYALGLLVSGMTMVMLSSVLSSVFSGAGKFSFLIVCFIGMPIVYASFYVSYRDVFVAIREDA